MRRYAALVITAILMAGCTPRTGQPGRPASGASESLTPTACPRVVVAGIDRTGSYALAGMGRDQVADLILKFACPGDTWYVRWIMDNSYSDRAMILTLRMPEPLTRPLNPFSRKDRSALDQIQKTRLAAALLLRRQRIRPVVGTDIWGFLAKAAILLSGSPEGVPRVLIMATDLGDTRNMQVPLDLKGVFVYVVGYQSGANPARSIQRRRFWEHVLRNAGAERVTFVDPSDAISHVWQVATRKGER